MKDMGGQPQLIAAAVSDVCYGDSFDRRTATVDHPRYSSPIWNIDTEGDGVELVRQWTRRLTQEPTTKRSFYGRLGAFLHDGEEQS